MENIPNEIRTKCEVWTRVMGYYRPVTSFNNGKQSEEKERKMFKEHYNHRTEECEVAKQ